MGPSRLVRHTLAAAVLFGSSVVAPLLLLNRRHIGTTATVLGLPLLATGGSSLLGAGLSLSPVHEEGRWRSLVAAVWICNPCLVLAAGEWLDFTPAMWLSGLPLALALCILCGCGREGEAEREAGSRAGEEVAADIELETRRPAAEAASEAGDSERTSEGGESEDESENEASSEHAEGENPWVEMEVEDEEEGEELEREQAARRARRPALADLRRGAARAALVAASMAVLSFQLGLYVLPSRDLPSLSEASAVAWGACALMFAKLYATCASLGQQRFSQAGMLTMLMLADWVSYVQVRAREDGMKQATLLSLLLVMGLCQSARAIARLKLRPRWLRVLALRRAQARVVAADSELGTPMAPSVPRRVDSSDSDDEQGPGSLPEGFHGAIAGVLGISPTGYQPRQREWLCGARSALVVLGAPAVQQGNRDTEASDSEAGGTSPSSPSRAEAPTQEGMVGEVQQGGSSGSRRPAPVAEGSALEVAEAERLCVVCQEDIQTGEQVRPLPKCGHKFHAACLERWAVVMGEATRCPTCRRPALMRRTGRGAVSVSALAAAAEEREMREVVENSFRLPSSYHPPVGLRVSGALRRWALRDGGMRPEVFDVSEEEEEDEEAVLQGWAPQEEAVEQLEPAEVQAEARGGVPAPAQRRSQTQEFEVSIEKDGTELGLDVLQHDWETLLITRIKDGPLRTWNRHHPQHSVRHGDRIIEVNGQRGDSELLISTIRSERSLRIVIRRLVEFCVSVQRLSGHRLGLDVTQHPRSLRVLQVSEGPFRRWNAGVNFDFQVQPSDHIVAVNGVHGSSATLLSEIRDSASPSLQLVLVRRRTPAPTPPPAAATPHADEGPAGAGSEEG